MVAIGNPIRGPLHEYGWQRPPGNTDMVVTQTAAQHMSSANHVAGPPALDIGDGDPDRDDILSPHSGVVAQALTVGSANLSIDWTASDGKVWRVVLAHNTLPHPVAVSQQLIEGQVVGRMGNSSIPTMPVPIHLHIQLGWWNGSAWVWVDPWPYLRQNGATEGDMLQGANPVAVSNRRGTILGLNTRFRSSPFVRTDNILAEYAPGVLIDPDYTVDGTNALGTNRWYGGWGMVGAIAQFGYVNVNAVGDKLGGLPGTLAPIEQSGHTDQELQDTARKAGHNAAVEVSAVGQKALADVAAKYPA